jgi:predicted nucleotidyltransferase
MHTVGNTLLEAVVGSTAYGLAHEGSDKDYLGLYAVPTAELLGLNLPDLEKAREYKNPDTKYYEVLHYCRLALKSNPSILELLWLDEYELMTNFGRKLIKIRDAFPSASYVRHAYLGYASQQYGKLLRDKRVEKRAKNARHFLRLLHQGSFFYLTGELQVKLSNPEYYIDAGNSIAQGNLWIAQRELQVAEAMFDEPSALPEKPDRETVNNWLLGVRRGFQKY